LDNITHSLVGAVIGQAGLKRKTGLAMPALILGANLPDIDGACYFLDNMQHLALRRGLTHGPIAWVVLPFLLAGLLYGFDRWQAQRGKRPEGREPVNFKWLYLLSLIACLTHPALDWMNVYGIRLLEPFSSRWFYGDVLFIIDVWLWAGLGFATWLSLRREKRGGNWRNVGRTALAGALAYIGVNAGITATYEQRFRATFGEGPDVIASPPPVLFWRREGLVGSEHRWAILEPSEPDEGQMHTRELGTSCAWPDVETLRRTNPALDNFLFWSRAPFAEAAPDGGIAIRDARFYDPRAEGRFTVLLPGVPCDEPAAN
jgi:inner membrane protein